MVGTLNFYVDESGTRKPDRAAMTFDPRTPKFFALGGVLVREEDEESIKAAHQLFCADWEITYPLHSVDMRHGMKEFSWLRRDSPEYQPFMDELTHLLTAIPVTGLACVIDRCGYDARYREKYGRNQWNLCQTAFSVVVERAAKHARSLGRALRIFPERCSKQDDKRLSKYFNDLRSNGPPFDAATSKAYAPLTAREFSETLVDLDFKTKASRLTQIADLYLWPVAMYRYKPECRPYRSLRDAGRLIEAILREEERASCGTKYSCFQLVDDAAIVG